MKTVRLMTTCLLALLFCGNVNAATIKVTGGDTFVQIDANALRSLGLDITGVAGADLLSCLLYTSSSPRDAHESRMPSSA